MLHTAAYWLLHTLRGLAPKRSFWCAAQFDTLRLALIKVAARVTELATRIKIALPYALAAATTGELLAARYGLGSLLSHAAQQFDMTGVYAALLVLMAMGILTSETATLTERRLLRWRHAGG